MTDLRNPDLRVRDLRHIVRPKIHSIIWDPGIEQNNEWIYASLENEAQRNRLVRWLKEKNINEDYECVYFNDSWTEAKLIKWQNLVSTPEKYFSGESFEVVGFDLTWFLGYAKQGVARFGRWKPEKTEPSGLASLATLGG